MQQLSMDEPVFKNDFSYKKISLSVSGLNCAGLLSLKKTENIIKIKKAL